MEEKGYWDEVHRLAALPTDEVVDKRLARDAWAREVGEFVLTSYQTGLKLEGRERAECWFRSLITFVEQIMCPALPIPEFHQWWYWWLITESCYLNLAAMGHAKSTVHGVYYPTWRIVCDNNIRILLGGETSTMASIRVDACRTQLDSNPLLIAAFGHLNPAEIPPEQRLTKKEKWIASEFVVNRSNFALADPTMRAVGVGGATLGARCDIGIGDDIVSPKNCNTLGMSAKTMSWLDTDFYSRVEPNGQFILVGTPQKWDDPYQRIRQEKNSVYRVFIGDAVTREGPGGEILETLWGDKFPPAELEKRKQVMGIIAFNRAYRLKVQSEETATFPEVFFVGGMYDKQPVPGCLEKSLTYRDLLLHWRSYDITMAVMGVDPDLVEGERGHRMGRERESAQANYFADLVLGYSKKLRRVMLLHLRRDKLNWTQQKQEVYNTYEVFKPRLVVVEKNHYQHALVAQTGEDHPTVPVVGVFTGINKIDPMVGIEAMQPHVESGLFLIPYGDTYSKAKSDLLLAEFTHWPLWPTDDILMAFWVAWTRLEPMIRRQYAADATVRKMYRPGGQGQRERALQEYDAKRRRRSIVPKARRNGLPSARRRRERVMPF
jgi:hypothetical protein